VNTVRRINSSPCDFWLTSSMGIPAITPGGSGVGVVTVSVGSYCGQSFSPLLAVLALALHYDSTHSFARTKEGRFGLVRNGYREAALSQSFCQRFGKQCHIVNEDAIQGIITGILLAV